VPSSRCPLSPLQMRDVAPSTCGEQERARRIEVSQGGQGRRSVVSVRAANFIWLLLITAGAVDDDDRPSSSSTAPAVISHNQIKLAALTQSSSRGGKRMVEDLCYEIRRAEACVD